MPTCLLKRVLPFTLTFIIGAALGGFFNPFGAWGVSRRVVLRTELMRDYDFGEGHGCRARRFKRRELVAESKPLVIEFKPDARWSRGAIVEKEGLSAHVRVTFGADGEVQQVEQLDALPRAAQEAVEQAARQILFIPEMLNGRFISVTKDIEIRFATPAEINEP